MSLLSIPALFFAAASDESDSLPAWAIKAGLRRYSEDEKEMMLALGLIEPARELQLFDTWSKYPYELPMTHFRDLFEKELKNKIFPISEIWFETDDQPVLGLRNPILAEMTSWIYKIFSSTDGERTMYEYYRIRVIEYTDEFGEEAPISIPCWNEPKFNYTQMTVAGKTISY